MLVVMVVVIQMLIEARLCVKAFSTSGTACGITIALLSICNPLRNFPKPERAGHLVSENKRERIVGYDV
eukprot:SAG31_NODE_2844_length_5009_cov_2.067006_6_plen_69_part_00